jgi:predicted PurR-regulated permease PerM
MAHKRSQFGKSVWQVPASSGENLPPHPMNESIIDSFHEQYHHKRADPPRPLSPQRRIAKWLLVGGVVGFLIWFFWSARAALPPFIVGIVLTYIMIPSVNRLNRHMPRWVAILLVYMGTILFLIGLASFGLPMLIDQAKELINLVDTFDVQNVMKTRDAVMIRMQSIYEMLPDSITAYTEDSVPNYIEMIQRNVITYGQDLLAFLIGRVLQVANTVIFIFGMVIVPVWMFHLINDYRSGYQVVNSLLPKQIRTDVWAIAKIIDRVLGSYIRGQLVLSIAVGSAAGLGLSVLSMFGLKVDYILLLAVIAGITEFVPVIGPVLGAIPAIIFGLFSSPATVIAVMILYLGIQVLENTFLVPRIVGDSVGIHPAVLIIMMTISAQVFGVLGVILVAPVLAISRDIFIYLYRRINGELVPTEVAELTVEAKEPSEQPEQAEQPELSKQPEQAAHVEQQNPVVEGEEHPASSSSTYSEA